ncbi:IclR family transcriptional regulator [Caldicoprobacter algeriensis]|uniref:IclR family transcriptional regulator n=1 Tax=Caldicoprobacter algeriensis TaxID=699281 RepID=UPI00207B0587|nr:IclR family transcriptional regulator [Caldicoprobacter algeriensis]MCM8900193.1 IclR family transcriptional regulator [Caldicoprobacter algeriensis]
MEVKIKSLEKALKILECFTPEEPELGVTEISRKLDMHKSSVFNIVDTLKKCGYLEQDPKNGKYRLGLKVLKLSYNLYSSYDVRKTLRPLLEDVSHKTNETVYLGVLYEEEVIYIDAVFPLSSTLTRNIIGIKAPLYCTAIGKALLASLPDDMIEKILSRPLEAYTQSTITDREKLWEEIKHIRMKGYAVDNMEHEYGIKCVGIAIKGLNGLPICAVSISGPSLRFNEDKIREYASILMRLKKKAETFLL